jgi:hypothetical protein
MFETIRKLFSKREELNMPAISSNTATIGGGPMIGVQSANSTIGTYTGNGTFNNVLIGGANYSVANGSFTTTWNKNDMSGLLATQGSKFTFDDAIFTTGLWFDDTGRYADNRYGGNNYPIYYHMGMWIKTDPEAADFLGYCTSYHSAKLATDPPITKINIVFSKLSALESFKNWWTPYSERFDGSVMDYMYPILKEGTYTNQSFMPCANQEEEWAWIVENTTHPVCQCGQYWVFSNEDEGILFVLWRDTTKNK